MSLERARHHVTQGFLEEASDRLVCSLCKLEFTSHYRKQSHYFGKSHLQSLLQLVGESWMSRDYNSSSLSLSLKMVAAEYHCKSSAGILLFDG